MPEVTTFMENEPSGLLRVGDTKQSPADRLWLRMEAPFHCHREKQQGFTSLHSAVSHNGNEVRQLIFKRKLARWLYRTQADACGSRAIECFRQLAHRCWPPLPTNRIVCDTGSDDLLRRICHPVCSVSVTPSKTRLIGLLLQMEDSVHCHREKQQGFTTLHSAVSHSVNEVGKLVFKR